MSPEQRQARLVGAALIAIGTIFLGEPITAIQLMGAGLVLAAVLAISLHR